MTLENNSLVLRRIHIQYCNDMVYTIDIEMMVPLCGICKVYKENSMKFRILEVRDLHVTNDFFKKMGCGDY